MTTRQALAGAAVVAALLGAAGFYRAVGSPAKTTAATVAGGAAGPGALARAETETGRDPAASPGDGTGPRPGVKSGKAMTASRAALLGSTIPVVAELSIDRQGSPRERLLAAQQHGSEPRQAQLDRLDDRASAHLARLRDEQAAAQGEKRADLGSAIAMIEQNEAYRSRLLAPTVHADARPGSTRKPR